VRDARPSLQQQIPHLTGAQVRALRSIARAGGRLPLGTVPRDMAASLLEARAIRADRLTRDLRLTHLGLLALLQSQTANQVPTLAQMAARQGTGFVAIPLALERDR